MLCSLWLWTRGGAWEGWAGLLLLRQGNGREAEARNNTNDHFHGIRQPGCKEMTQVFDAFPTSPPPIIVDLFDVLENLDQSYKKERWWGEKDSCLHSEKVTLRALMIINNYETKLSLVQQAIHFSLARHRRSGD